MGPPTYYNIKSNFLWLFFLKSSPKDMIPLTFRERGKKRERKRHIKQLPSLCTATGYSILDPLVHRITLQPTKPHWRGPSAWLPLSCRKSYSQTLAYIVITWSACWNRLLYATSRISSSGVWSRPQNLYLQNISKNEPILSP